MPRTRGTDDHDTPALTPGGFVANFDFRGKSANRVSEIQGLTDAKTPQKAHLRQNL
jgi:hypothetical protein